MSFKLGVLLVHGIGNQDPEFADNMIQALRRKIKSLGADDNLICFEPVWWAPVLSEREEALLAKMSKEKGLDNLWMPLRRFVVQVLADAIAYQDTPTSQDQINVYDEIHETFRKKVHELRNNIHNNSDSTTQEAPLIVIAHSLGCHMISNYIWDVRKSPPDSAPENPFERFETISSIITMGCNIPLFTLAYTNLEPISFQTMGISSFFPPGTPQASLDKVTKWLNFYDPDDVLGYPLKPLGAKYNTAVSEDIAINAGNLLQSWNPLSHMAYWTDEDVIRLVASLLSDTLKLL